MKRIVAMLMLAVLPALTGCGTSASVRGFQRESPLEVGGVALPDVTVDGSGGEFTMKAKPSELLIAYFGYTSCPDVCPTTLTALRGALVKLGPERAGRVDVAMATVDPDRDRPANLSDYLGSFFTRYHALRTTDIAQLSRAEKAFLAGSTRSKRADGIIEITHTGTAFVVNSDGDVVVEWPFGTTSKTMANDLSVLLKTA